MRRLVLVAAAALIALAAVEAVLRAFPPAVLGGTDPLILRRPEWSTWTFRPGLDVERTGPDGRRFRFRTNALGLRGPEWPPPTPGRKRIALVGDSFMAGLQVPEEEVFANRLAAHLAAAGLEADVLNLGVNAHNLAEEASLWEVLRDRAAADLLVWAVFVGNDVAAYNLRRETRPPAWYRRFRLYLLVREAIVGIRARLRGGGGGAADRAAADAPPDGLLHAAPPDSATASARLERLRNAARLFRPGDPETEDLYRRTEAVLSARVAAQQPDLVLLLPAAEGVDPRRIVEMRARAPDGSSLDLGYATTRLAAACARAGLPVLDLTEALAAAEEAGRPTFWEWEGHWTPAGHDAAAAAAAGRIAEILKRSPVLEAVGRGPSR